MNHPFKRVMGLVLALLMLVSLMPMSVFAEYKSGDTWFWSDDKSTLYIKDGQSIDLYDALADKNGIPDKGAFRYDLKDYSSTGYGGANQWHKSGDRITDGSSRSLSETTYYAVPVEKITPIINKDTVGSVFSFNVKYFYTISYGLVDGADADGQGLVDCVNASGNTITDGYVVKSGEAVTFIVTPVDGWYVEVEKTETGKAAEKYNLENPEDYTFTFSGPLSAHYAFTYKSNEVTRYNVTVEKNENWGTAVLKSADKLVEGDKALVEVIPNVSSASVEYSIVSVMVGNTPLEKNPDGYYEYTMGAEDATLTVTFSKIQLTGAATATVKFDRDKYAAGDLDALKEELFTQIGVDYFPTDIVWNTNGVEYKYYQYHNAGIGNDGFNAGLITLGQPAKADDTSLNPHTYYDFGERFCSGGSANEKVRISYNGLYIEADITLTEGREYTVKWLDSDGTVLEIDENVTHGTSAEYNNRDGKGTVEELAAAKTNAQYTYTFAGWTPAVDAITGYTEYTATYITSVNNYTVIWKNDNGDVLETDTDVPFGTVPNYDNANSLGTTEALAAAKNDKQYTYTFAGWTPKVDAITGNTEYTATYDKTVNKYTIIFKNGDTVLQESKWEYGETPVYDAETNGTPAKGATAQYAYTFSGWDNEIVPVTGEMTYNAKFSQSVNGYTVIWMNEDGTVLETDENVSYGSTPEYNSAEPTKAADENNTYHFDGWTPSIDVVKGDVTYTAVFSTAAKIKVTFSVNGDTSRYINVVAGECVSAYTAPNIDGWQFGGWYADEVCTEPFDFYVPITEATTVYAKMTKIHTVSFNVSGGDITINDQSVLDGECALEPAVKPDKAEETFIGWFVNDELYDFGKAVTADIVLTAKYGEDKDNDEKVDGSDEDPFLTYVWKDGEEVLHSATILSGAAEPTYTISDPDDNGKIFVDWAEAVEGYTTTYTANWADDCNNNDVTDASETGTVTVNVVGEGNVTLTPAGSAELLKQEGNVYTYLWDSTDENNKVINITTSLIDTNANDGSVDYLVSAPASVKIGESVTVEFGKHTLDAHNGTIKINGYWEAWANSKVFDTLKADTLKAAGLNGDPSNYTVVFVTRLGNVDLDELNMGSKTAFFTTVEVPESGRSVIITDNVTGVSKTISISIIDSRTAAVINTESVKAEYTADTIAALEAAIKADITAINNSGGAIEAGRISVKAAGNALDLDGETYAATVTVSGGEDWLENTATVTVTGKLKTYTVTFVNHDGSELWSGSFGYDTTPTYGGETPTKADAVDAYGNVMATYTHSGWDKEITAVKGEATYTASYTETAATYTVKYVNFDCTELKSYTVNYGAAEPVYDGEVPVKPSNDPAVIYVHSGYELTSGKEAVDGKVVGDMVYTAQFTTEDVYTIKYVTGKTEGEWDVYDTQYINLTQNADALIENSPKGNPDANNEFAGKIFLGWGSKAGTSPKGEEKVIILEAVWEEEANNNNVSDEDETAYVAVNVTNNNGAFGKVELSGAIIANTAAGENGSTVYTVIYDSAKEGGNVVTVTVTADDTGVTDVKYYVASAPASVSVEDGKTAEVNVTFDAHSLGGSNATIPGNGATVALKKETLTKEAVLKAILGEEAAKNAGEYTVKMFVRLGDLPIVGTIEGYYDIWAVNSWADTVSNAIWEKAVDIPGSESFEITWKKSGYPTVSGKYTINFTDARPVAEATHNGDTYNASALDDALLKDIEADISVPEGVIYTVSWGQNNPAELVEDQTYTVYVTVTLAENEEYQGRTQTIAVTVHVPVTKATITILGTADMTYNTGMTDADKVQMVLDAVKPDFHPDELKDTEVTVWYKANSARNVPLELNLAAMDLGVYGYLLPDTVTIQIPVQDMWMNIGDEFPETKAPTNDQLEAIVVGLVEKYAAEFLAGELSEAELYDILAITMKQNPELKLYYDFYGAHKFGENEVTDENGNPLETVYVTQADTGYGALKSNESVLTLADLREETTIKLNEGIAITYRDYDAAKLLTDLVDGVYDQQGNKIAGADKVVFVTDVSDLPASEGTNITVKFAGDIKYKSSTATGVVVVNKADCEVVIDNQVVKYGSDYNKLPVSTVPAGVDTIQFVVGMDISRLSIDTSAGVSADAIRGIVGSVQLMLPDELQHLLEMADGLLKAAGLNITFADGASIKLSELKKSIDVLSEVMKDSAYAEYFNVLLNMLGSLPTDNLDVEIIIGGTLPENIGVYLIGAVTADANYNTAFGVGVMAITPDGYRAELGWKMPDANGIITLPVLKNGEFDTSAEVVSVYEGTVEAAQEKLLSFFVGVDVYDQKIEFTTDQKTLSTGSYVQLALIKDFGNTMYYAVPIVRAFVVVPALVDMSFATVTEEGAVPGKDFVYTYDAQAKTPVVSVDGKVMQPGDNLTVKYYGLTLKGEKYESSSAPTQAGVYTAIALYIERDENGELVKAGMAIAGIVIKMNGTATVEVSNTVNVYTGAKYDISSMITAKDEVEGDNAAVTVITGMVANEGDFSEIGWESIGGSVNVDFPTVLDTMLKKTDFFAKAYENNAGIDVNDVIAAVESVRASIVELGISSETVDSVINVLSQLPDSVKITFADKLKVSEIGIYAVCAIVTDPNFLPAADAGLMVITPDVNKVYLKFDYEDSNNIFTQDIFEYIDLSASAYTDAEYTVKDEAATAKVTELFISIDAEGNIVTYKDKAELANGAYIELAYIELEVGGIMTVSDIIARPVVIVPSAVKVEFEGGNKASFTYDGNAHTLGDVIVTDNEGRVIDAKAEDIILTYVGLDGKFDGYYSNSAPTNAGTYLVIAAYLERSESGFIKRVGFGAGTVTIGKIDGEFALVETVVTYDGKPHEIEMYNPDESDCIIAYMDLSSGLINIMLEEKTQFVYDVLKKALVELGYMADDDVHSLKNILAAIELVLEKVNEYGLDEYIGESTMNTVDEMLAMALSMSELLGEDCTVCFNGDAPVNAGSYICVAANISANYNTVIAPGFLTIDPIEITVTMDNVTKVIGEEDPEFTYTVEGEALEGHELVVKPYRAEGETIGRYWIDAETEVINGGENYEIVFKSGRLKIEKVDLELAAEELAFTQWNESFDLEPTISQDCVSLEEIVWSSSDESVASVVNGVVTAVGNGEATITATVRGIEFECDVNCTLPVAKAETVRENGEVTAVKVNVEDLLTNFDKPEEGKTEGRTCTVIVGFYANGRLVSTRIFENTDGSSITIDKPEGADTVKIFVLDNTEDLPPLCRESVLELF